METNRETCTAAPSNCPLHDLPVRRRGMMWHRSIIGAMSLGVMGGCALIGAGWALFAAVRPPLVVLSSQMVTPEVPQDGSLQFLIRSVAEVNHACIASITREFYEPVTVEIDGVPVTIRHKKRTSGPAPILHQDENAYVIDIDLPPNMDTGDWTFEGESTFDCGYLWAAVHDFPRGILSGGVIRVRTQEMPFKVIPKGALARK